MKKNPPKNFQPLVLTLAVLFLLGSFEAGQAQVIYVKANNSTNLTSTASYIDSPATIPGVLDTIEFNNTITGALTIPGGGISINALNFQASLSQIQTLRGDITIGSGGLVNASTSSRLGLDGNFFLSTNQNWTTINTDLRVESLGKLTNNGHALSVSSEGTGKLVFHGATGMWGDSAVTISAPVTISLGANIALSGANTFSTLAIQSGTVSGNTLGNHGQASSFGTGGVTNPIVLGASTTTGTLIYTGNSTTSDRRFQRFMPNASNPNLTTGAIEVAEAGQTLTLTGIFSYNSSGSIDSAVRFGGAGNLTIESVIANNSGSGKSSLIKNGTGTLRLSGANTYLGQTTISNGTLLVIGQTGTSSGTGTNAVSVLSGAALGGTGRVGGAVTVDGAVTPGDGGIGTLTVANSLTWNGVGTNNYWQWNLGADNAADLLSLTGAFTKGTGSGWTFDFLGANRTGTFDLVTWGSTTFAAEDFSYASLAPGFTGDFAISGNTLQFTAIPEPSTAALLLLAVGILYTLRKRRSVA